MRAPKRPTSDDAAAVRESIFAQLEAIRTLSSGHHPSSELGLQLHAPNSPMRGNGGSATRGNTGHASVQLTPRTRRLPPIFAEQRRNVASIRTVCNSLREILQQLDVDFGRVSVSLPLPTAEVKDAAVGGDAPGEPIMQLLQRRSRRQLLARLQRTPSRTQRLAEVTRGGSGVEDLQDEINRARLAAADEGLSDEQSVSDYAEEPDVPRFDPGTQLRDEVEAMEGSLRKISECVATMTAIEECDAGNSWWSSAMRTREMKATGIRANYHARCILRWNQRAREHFLVEAVASNDQMGRCRGDMLYLREQHALFQKRIELSHQEQAEVAEEMKTLQDQLYDLNRTKTELQRQLVKAAHERQLLPDDCEDATLAELLLLLDYVSWPASLQPDVDCVKAWVRENAIPLDV
ncbi:hypothetical protein TraAM80_06310 [Trypanosoma rangeli]|uniref:Uncharacterized protein n=1 Tax=Trypanosoma rangeli TaxID=5698 RepID=A0A422NAX6_TRYRA|nr:uncharacterized protein TraAM80_06310 [Trypanosoma rangeli]RNF02628.1 hypothetical protein TraAM80_06310 [Trypanosoma rangeli]|eukprot:RNF02628.1 hypothetical protein TraAM80_06310 [Trypanosoma rangeli]